MSLLVKPAVGGSLWRRRCRRQRRRRQRPLHHTSQYLLHLDAMLPLQCMCATCYHLPHFCDYQKWKTRCPTAACEARAGRPPAAAAATAAVEHSCRRA